MDVDNLPNILFNKFGNFAFKLAAFINDSFCLLPGKIWLNTAFCGTIFEDGNKVISGIPIALGISLGVRLSSICSLALNDSKSCSRKTRPSAVGRAKRVTKSNKDSVATKYTYEMNYFEVVPFDVPMLDNQLSKLRSVVTHVVDHVVMFDIQQMFPTELYCLLYN